MSGIRAADASARRIRFDVRNVSAGERAFSASLAFVAVDGLLVEVDPWCPHGVPTLGCERCAAEYAEEYAEEYEEHGT